MTKKRYNVFKNRIGNWIVEDNVDDKYLLNIPKFLGFNDKESANVFCNELNLLHKENEQLQQRNDRQAKQLDRLYSLIEEKDWRALSDIIDDFKRCEEQLQRESGTYGDFE